MRGEWEKVYGVMSEKMIYYLLEKGGCEWSRDF